MIRVLRMDLGKPVKHRILAVKHAMMEYFRRKNLASIVRPGGIWKPGHGRIVVDAVVAGIMSFDFRRDVRAEVDFNRITSDPKQMSEVLDFTKVMLEVMEEGMKYTTFIRPQEQVCEGSGQAPGGRMMQGTAPGLKRESEQSNGAPAGYQPHQAFGGECHICHEVGHKAWQCPEKRD